MNTNTTGGFVPTDSTAVPNQYIQPSPCPTCGRCPTCGHYHTAPNPGYAPFWITSGYLDPSLQTFPEQTVVFTASALGL